MSHRGAAPKPWSARALIVALLVLPLALLAGCTITPKAVTQCDIARYPLAVNDPSSTPFPGVVPGRPRAHTLARRMSEALAEPAGPAPENAMLFMSGGSQHGAFGAGFLKGWKDKRGALPRFRVVTGVSTGSILATYAFVGDVEAAVAGYTIANEKELLDPYARADGSKIGAGSVLALLQKGAIANLVPLRARLSKSITDDMLRAVAQGQADGRALFIGVVDVDSSEAIALDMTDLARRWADATEPGRKAQLRSCYVEAIIASSSAPIAAPPVFIDNRMYIDGGARFGVISEEIGTAISDRTAAVGHPITPFVYLIVNGTQKIDTRCPTAACTGDPPAAGNAKDPHRDWNFLELALRSEEILTNQVYRFSAERIASSMGGGRVLRFFKIGDDMLGFEAALADSGTSVKLSCAAWRARDAADLKPVQFYPHYMRCLIAYGDAMARAQDW